jgi:hypothetical protein
MPQVNMTPEQLIEEGRKLQRPCTFLRPTGAGPVAAIWYERDDDRIEATGERCWLTVDSHHIPNLPAEVSGFVSVFTNEHACEGGRVEIASSWPDRVGTELYAHTESVLPPLDAVFFARVGRRQTARRHEQLGERRPRSRALLARIGRRQIPFSTHSVVTSRPVKASR